MGKPRTSLQNVILSDTSQILEIRGWSRRAEEREEWRCPLREPRTQKGV